MINCCSYTSDQIEYLKTLLPEADKSFFIWLSSVDGSLVKVHAMKEGSIVFASEPVMKIEGPLAICQLLETPIVNLVNFASLMATNAVRHRLLAGWDKRLIEFGARRAQGPDGAISASRYSYMGTFDATSNVLASQLFQIPCSGTQAHSFVIAFSKISDITNRTLFYKNKLYSEDYVKLVLDNREKICNLFECDSTMNEGELASFIAYSQSYPTKCICLVDTYDVEQSGVPNFLTVALTLYNLGFNTQGIRLDSGDLAYLSNRCRNMFKKLAQEFNIPHFSKLLIFASNDINADVLYSLNTQGHEIDAFGIGTHLVTCQAQPSLGVVFKLVQIEQRLCMKLTGGYSKMSLPGSKDVYRLYSKENYAIVDLVQTTGTPAPEINKKVECRHLTDNMLRCFVQPSRVESLLNLVWDGRFMGVIDEFTDEAARRHCIDSLKLMRPDHLRHINPTPYKVSFSVEFHQSFHSLWMNTLPMPLLT